MPTDYKMKPPDETPTTTEGLLSALLEEEKKQTSYIKSISTAVTVWFVLFILALILGGCSVLMNL